MISPVYPSHNVAVVSKTTPTDMKTPSYICARPVGPVESAAFASR